MVWPCSHVASLLVILALICGAGVLEAAPQRSFLSAGRPAAAAPLQQPPLASSSAVDDRYYSRQLLVYGKSAQAKISSAKAVVIGEGGLVDEVVKNLVLTGFGGVAIAESAHSNHSAPSLRGASQSLLDYARELNPKASIVSLSLQQLLQDDALLASLRASVVIVCDRDMELWKQVNDLCHRVGVKMVACQSIGTIGCVFNDFLEHRVEDAMPGDGGDVLPEVPLLDRWEEAQSNDSVLCTVFSIAEQRLLGAGLGDPVTLRSPADPSVEIRGVVHKLLTPHSCVLALDYPSDHALLPRVLSQSHAVLRYEKKRLSMSFERLSTQLLRPSVLPSNACLSPTSARIHSLAILAAVKLLSRLRGVQRLDRSLWMTALSAELHALLQTSTPLPPSPSSRSARRQGSAKPHSPFAALLPPHTARLLVDNMLLYHDHDSPATISVIGGLAAEEAGKAITAVHLPAQQFQVYEALDALPSTHLSQPPSLATLQRLEQERLRTLASLSLVVVGAGAIGCELLKTLALTFDPRVLEGSRSTPRRMVFDPDLIERTNLHRQLLYRERHVGQAKANVAVQQAGQLNPLLAWQARVQKITPDTGSRASDRFWQDVDIVLGAVDNREARQVVDAICIQHHLCWVDSGTQGTKASVQVVLPGVTESYGSMSDPPDPSVPVCTIKTFPYQPEHCVAWAKEIFQQMFAEEVRLMQSLLGRDARSSPSSLLSPLSEDELTSLWASLIYLSSGHREARLHACIQWAVYQYHRLFQTEVQALLREHPATSLDEDGQPFWKGARRLPRVLPLDWQDPLVQDFIIWSTRLRWQCLYNELLEPNVVRDVYQNQCSRLQTPVRDPPHLAHKDREAQVQDLLLRYGKHRPLTFQPQDFDKDDWSIGHVQWITSATNLRSRVYQLPELPSLQIQKVAGHIIPAVATTTAVVAGLACQEVLKLASMRTWPRPGCGRLARRVFSWLRSGLSRHLPKSFASSLFSASRPGFSPADSVKMKNSFVNLALPTWSFSQPAPPETWRVGDAEVSLWDQIVIPETLQEATVRSLETELQRRFGEKLRVASIVHKTTLLYADFFPDASEAQDEPLLQLLRRAREEKEEEEKEEEDGQVVLEVSMVGSESEGESRLPMVILRGFRERGSQERGRE